MPFMYVYAANRILPNLLNAHPYPVLRELIANRTLFFSPPAALFLLNCVWFRWCDLFRKDAGLGILAMISVSVAATALSFIIGWFVYLNLHGS